MIKWLSTRNYISEMNIDGTYISVKKLRNMFQIWSYLIR